MFALWRKTLSGSYALDPNQPLEVDPVYRFGAVLVVLI
jgi:hypothetical protein